MGQPKRRKKQFKDCENASLTSTPPSSAVSLVLSQVLLFKSLKFHNRLEKGLGCFSDIVVFAAFETVPADSRNLGRHVIPQQNELRSAVAGLHVSGPRPTALLCRFKHPAMVFSSRFTSLP